MVRAARRERTEWGRVKVRVRGTEASGMQAAGKGERDNERKVGCDNP